MGLFDAKWIKVAKKAAESSSHTMDLSSRSSNPHCCCSLHCFNILLLFVLTKRAFVLLCDSTCVCASTFPSHLSFSCVFLQLPLPRCPFALCWISLPLRGVEVEGSRCVGTNAAEMCRTPYSHSLRFHFIQHNTSSISFPPHHLLCRQCDWS